VERLGFRREGLLRRYLDIDGDTPARLPGSGEVPA
jgi:RimJ/RimL family protein N-acetyltransferase